MPLVDVRSEKVEQPANLTVPEKLGKVEGEPGAGYLRKNERVRVEAVFPDDPETESVEVEGHAPSVVGDPQCRHDVLYSLRLLRGFPHPKEFTRAFVRSSPAAVEAKPLGTTLTGSTVNEARTRNNYICTRSSLESPPVIWA